MHNHHNPQKPGILVVDDKPAERAALGTGLRRQGFAVWLAGDGHEALKLYSRRGAFDLVLLNVYMPGLDGPQTLDALRQFDPAVRCCFMCGHGGGYTDEELLERGAVALFNKPFGPAEIAPVLWQLLGRPHRGPHKRRSCPSVLSWKLWGRS